MPPAVVAHRGASAHRAEHTFAAYELALEQGSDGLECDVRLTRDGHLVCVHDRTVDRTSAGRGAVSELTLAQLVAMDFGSWHDDLPESPDELIRVPKAPPLVSGVLRFDALLELLADTPDVQLFVETKHPTRYAGLVEAKLTAALARHGLAKPASKDTSRVVMMSFSNLAVRRMREQAPRIPTVLLIDRMWGRREGKLPSWVDYAGPGVHLLHEDPGYVERAREQGHDTYVWTVDSAVDVALCGELDVRFLATNAPANTRRLLADSLAP